MPARRFSKARLRSRSRCRRSSRCFSGASMPPEAASLLQAAGIDAGYGTMQVLWGVDLDVRAGETVLLLGANGAGKTTFLKSLVGLIDARHGSIRLGGDDVTRMRSSDRMRLGMTYMSELAVFPDLSIEENIRVGAQALGHADPGARVEEMYGLFPALRDKRRAPASSLPGAKSKMLGTARALAAEPRLLVMDEPSARLSPLFVKEVIRILSDLRGRGLALLIAEQNIGFLEVATRVFVLEGGRIRFSGTVAEMTDNEALRRAYFGLKGCARAGSDPARAIRAIVSSPRLNSPKKATSSIWCSNASVSAPSRWRNKRA